MKFYSQFGEDEWIANNLQLPVDGFYLDVGCGHPERESNTAFLRDLGWSGIAVDGNKAWQGDWDAAVAAAAGCGKTEFAVRVIGRKTERVRFDIRTVPEHSRIDHGAEGCNKVHLAYSLDDFLWTRWVPKMDFLSLDLEGGEFDALMGLRWRPQIIVSEFNTWGIGQDFRVRDYLLENGYDIAHQTYANIIYVKK